MYHENDTRNDGAKGDTTARRVPTFGADTGDTGLVEPGAGPLGLVGAPVAAVGGPGGPRGAYVLQAVQGFMRGRGGRPTRGRKLTVPSTGLARAGCDSGKVQARLEFRA